MGWCPVVVQISWSLSVNTLVRGEWRCHALQCTLPLIEVKPVISTRLRSFPGAGIDAKALFEDMTNGRELAA